GIGPRHIVDTYPRYIADLRDLFAAPLDAELLHAATRCARTKRQQPSGSVRAFDAPLAPLQGGYDVVALDLLERQARRRRCRGLARGPVALCAGSRSVVR